MKGPEFVAWTVVGGHPMTKRAPFPNPEASSSVAGLQTLLKTFETVMLATLDRPASSSGEAPHLNARLMSVASVDDDCTLSFFTAGRDQLAEGRGHVIAQAKTCSLNLWGTFTVVSARAQMEAAFGLRHQAWFPQGLDEPGLCLITFKPAEAELRDMGRVQRIRVTPQISKLSIAPTVGVPARAIVMGCSAVAVLLAGAAAMQVMVERPIETASSSFLSPQSVTMLR
ncbi:MAG: pyridoxamine 5'-phosphate oxidase family protein [Deltaproteobacteria bacterium]|nr:pyridoxamine 5'-phosphate oxidase family protein [Deltaproteobacteria bacterium]